MNKGKFIVFEGGEGSGKTTQAKLLADFLRSQGQEVLHTKEPGGDDGVCKDIKKILLNTEYKDKLSHRAEFLLFEADRAQHVKYIIRPALEMGKVVISDRYEAATFAYQCGAREVCAADEFKQLNAFATGGLSPDFHVYIDIDPEVGLARKAKEGVLTRFEKEDLEFHKKVRAGYLEFFEKHIDENRWQKFDGILPIEELHQQILQTLKEKTS